MDEQKMNSCDPQDEHKGAVSSASHSSHSAPTTPSGSLTRQILSLAIPALGALVAAPIFTLIDTAMVGHLGTEELAGLATATTIVQTIVGLFVWPIPQPRSLHRHSGPVTACAPFAPVLKQCGWQPDAALSPHAA